MRLIYGLILMLMVLAKSALAACPGEQMATGWCWPTGTSTIGSYLKFGERNPKFRNRRHLAQDIDAVAGTSVYAIADGVIIHARGNVGSYGGKDCSGRGIRGGGVIIRHHSKDGKTFLVLYAHMVNVHGTGIVHAGEKIGEVGVYRYCNRRMDHLHFAIRFPDKDDGDRWTGYERNGSFLGFTNPITFLNSHKPLNVPTCLALSDSDGVMCWSGEGTGNFAFCEDGYDYVRFSYPLSQTSVPRAMAAHTARSICDDVAKGPYGRYPHAKQVDIRPYIFGDKGSVHFAATPAIGAASALGLTTLPPMTTIHTDPPPTAGTPWDGYKHRVGLKSVRLCKHKDTHCKGLLETTLADLPHGRDIRVTLARKAGKWLDVSVDAYCSADRDFGNGDDIFLGSERKKLSKKKYQHKKKKSVYIENVDLSSCITKEGETYYLFAVVHYDGGINPSTEDDSDEHVRIVVKPKSVPQPAPTPTPPAVSSAPPASVPFGPAPLPCAGCVAHYIVTDFWDVTVDNVALNRAPNALGSIIAGDSNIIVTIWEPERLQMEYALQDFINPDALVQACYNYGDTWDVNTATQKTVDTSNRACGVFTRKNGMMTAVLTVRNDILPRTRAEIGNISLRTQGDATPQPTPTPPAVQSAPPASVPPRPAQSSSLTAYYIIPERWNVAWTTTPSQGAKTWATSHSGTPPSW